MRWCAAVLALVVFASVEPGAAAPTAASLDGLQTEVFGSHGGKTLLGAHPPVAPDTSPEGLPQDLYELSPEGALRPLARGVSFAAYAPDGAVLYVRDGALFELSRGESRLLAQPVLGDFAVDPLGQRIAIARPDSEPDSWLELIDRSGRHLAVLIEPRGPNAWPLFSPGGDTVYFISGSTGVYSWFSVGVDGEGLRQLTNHGLKPGPDVLGAAFVPPPAFKSSIHFIGPALVEYDAGDGLWRLDLATGKAERIGEVRP